MASSIVLKTHGRVPVPPELLAVAHTVKHQNYQVNTPKKFQKNHFHDLACQDMCRDIAQMLNVDAAQVDFVYFACSQGAEPHVDELDPTVFTHRTILVPLVLPTAGKTLFRAQHEVVEMQLGVAYEFNHEKEHELTVEDTASGCVLLMASVKK